MQHDLKILFNGEPMLVRPGTRIEDLFDNQHPHPGRFPALGAFVNNRPVGLSYELRSNADVTSIDLSCREGMDIYRRTTSTLLYAALADLDPQAVIKVGQSIGTGYFFEITHKLKTSFIEKLQQHMQQMVQANLPIVVERTTVEDAIERLSEHPGTKDQGKLIGMLRQTEALLAHLGNYTGLVHGPIASHTGVIDRFMLYSYEHGLVLDFPNEQGELPPSLAPQPKLFSTYVEAKRWNELLKVETIADLNAHCMRRDLSDLVKVAEALHEKKIAALSDVIAANKNIQLIVIAGPSASGKTTFAKRLSIHLKIHGIEPVALSLDNYYRPREECPRHPDGTFDFENLEALDVVYFNQQLEQLLKGEKVETPLFSFNLGRRHPTKTHTLQLHKGQVLITEGIHGLNERLSASVPHKHKFKIYVSALTQLCIDSHNRIFTTDTRLIRRIVRDRLYRNASAAETITLWPSVRAGESQYIFPFQEDADVMFNSALIYEYALLKSYAERFLMEVPRDHPSFMEATRLTKFLSLFIPILPDEVPRTSIIREFIGGSTFQYG